MDNQDITEQEASTALGITVKQLSELRAAHLQQEVHWVRKHRRFLYKAPALKTLAEVLAKAGSSQDGGTACVPVVESREVETLVVWRTAQHGVRNTRVLEAHWPKKDPRTEKVEILRVRVANNTTFVRGMEILCRHVSLDLWEHWDPVKKTAAASPRARGRW